MSTAPSRRGRRMARSRARDQFRRVRLGGAGAVPELRSTGSKVERAAPRSTTVILGAAIVIEGSLYSALAPVLPQLRDRFALTETAAGLLMSGYAAGTVAGALLGAATIRVWGARTTALGALLTFALTVALFALVDTAAAATYIRIGQGAGAGCLWTACNFWLVSAVPASRRGEVLGQAAGFTLIGTIAGPVLGTFASIIGLAPTHFAIAVACLVVAGAMATLRPPTDFAIDPLGGISVPQSSSTRIALVVPAGLILLAGSVAGLVHTIGPLAMDERGIPEAVIGLVFVAAAALAILVGRLVGRATDRGGAERPIHIGLLCTAAMLFLLATAAEDRLTYAIAIAACVACLLTFYIPATAALTLASRRTRWALPTVLAVSGLAWGTGEMLGSGLSGAGADRRGDTFVLLSTVGLLLATSVAVRYASHGTRELPDFSASAGNELDD